MLSSLSCSCSTVISFLFQEFSTVPSYSCTFSLSLFPIPEFVYWSFPILKLSLFPISAPTYSSDFFPPAVFDSLITFIFFWLDSANSFLFLYWLLRSLFCSCTSSTDLFRIPALAPPIPFLFLYYSSTDLFPIPALAPTDPFSIPVLAKLINFLFLHWLTDFFSYSLYLIHRTLSLPIPSSGLNPISCSSSWCSFRFIALSIFLLFVSLHFCFPFFVLYSFFSHILAYALYLNFIPHPCFSIVFFL